MLAVPLPLPRGEMSTKQFVTPEEIAALAVFPSSDMACSITGIILPIDGGWTAQ